MKQILLILCALSFFPLLSSAGVAKPPIIRPYKPVLTTPVNKAFNQPSVRPIGKCASDCAQAATELLAPKTAKTLNRMPVEGKEAILVGQLVGMFPAVNAKLQNAGWTPTQARGTTTSLVGAMKQATQSKNPEFIKGVLGFTEKLAVEGPQKHAQQLQKIKANCLL